MFLQKLSLDPKQSYSTTATLENIIENLQLSFNHIPILTPFTSNSDSMEVILENLKKSHSTNILTPSMFVSIAHLFDCTHVILQDRELMEKFDLDLTSIPKPIIELENTNQYPLLNLCKMHIKAKDEDAFVVLYILSKLFKGKVVAKKTEKLKIFFKVFEIDWEVLSYEDKCDTQHECLVFMDGYVENKSERIFCLGNNSNKFDQLKIDLSLAGKFKSRIGEVYRAITPAILKGHKEFDYSRFSSIAK